MIRPTLFVMAVVAGNSAIAQDQVDLEQLNCFVAILAGRPADVLNPNVDLYLEGVLQGALAATKDDPGWFGRFSEACLADPNRSISVVIEEANMSAP